MSFHCSILSTCAYKPIEVVVLRHGVFQNVMVFLLCSVAADKTVSSSHRNDASPHDPPYAPAPHASWYAPPWSWSYASWYAPPWTWSYVSWSCSHAWWSQAYAWSWWSHAKWSWWSWWSRSHAWWSHANRWTWPHARWPWSWWSDAWWSWSWWSDAWWS